ncbi:MAG: thermonuclease family protein [Acidobacteriia bacterium]|nr:thermonuclease family protein [Terriglobia bacterium]
MGHLAHGKDATALCNKIDRYRRGVCVVYVQPPDCPTCDQTVDVALAQVAVGAAWWYREYAKEPSADDRARYSVAEQDARAHKLGLWRDKDPVPPWEWRRNKNSYHHAAHHPNDQRSVESCCGAGSPRHGEHGQGPDAQPLPGSGRFR